MNYEGKKLNNRSQDIIDLINKYAVCIINDLHLLPTYNSILGMSCIDPALYRNINKNCINEFKVHDDISLSDHCLITFDLLYHGRKKYTEKTVHLSEINKWKFRLDLTKFSEIKSEKKNK